MPYLGMQHKRFFFFFTCFLKKLFIQLTHVFYISLFSLLHGYLVRLIPRLIPILSCSSALTSEDTTEPSEA